MRACVIIASKENRFLSSYIDSIVSLWVSWRVAGQDLVPIIHEQRLSASRTEQPLSVAPITDGSLKWKKLTNSSTLLDTNAVQLAFRGCRVQWVFLLLKVTVLMWRLDLDSGHKYHVICTQTFLFQHAYCCVKETGRSCCQCYAGSTGRLLQSVHR